MTDLLTPTTLYPPPSPEPVDELDGTLICARIVDITHDVKSFTFEPPSSASLRHLPGQYLTFNFDIDGTPIERCYTISAAPSRTDLTITVKRVPGGTVSNWLHDQLRLGDTIRAKGPFGQFSHALSPSEKYLFITAGSGITPAMSMLRTLCDTNDPAQVTFIHCARTPADIIFADELDQLARQYGIGLSILCESDSPSDNWQGRLGRLTLPGLLSICPDLLDREIFTCGPPPFMAAVRGQLDQIRVDPARYHEESFTLGDQLRDNGDGGPVATGHQVEFRRSSQVIECDSATTILQAAAQAGLALPASCGEGICGTCKTQSVTGSVDMRHAGGIRPKEIEEGKVLLCCSTPTSDVVLDA